MLLKSLKLAMTNDTVTGNLENFLLPGYHTLQVSHLELETHLLKLARFCITLAMSVSVRDVGSAGYSCIRLNREGDMMAGHMKRRKRDELMRLSARSSLPRSAHLALHEAKTSFSSRGNMLESEGDIITQRQGEKNTAAIRNPARSENRWRISGVQPSQDYKKCL